MLNQFSRTELLIGKDNLEKIKNAKVAVFEIGGVGSYVVEGLTRAGISNFILIDNDEYSLTNLNRQLYATNDTIGRKKVEVAKERILKINDKANVTIYDELFMPENNFVNFDGVDYIVDAIDTVKAKIELVKTANKLNIPIISCMGTGNKLDPTKLEISDIKKTSVCPLAKVMRKELKKIGITSLKVVYSKEEPIKVNKEDLEIMIKEEGSKKRSIPASISFVPSVAGLIIVSEIIKDIINK